MRSLLKKGQGGEETPRGTEPQGAPPSGASHLTQAQSLSQNGKHRKGTIKPKYDSELHYKDPYKGEAQGDQDLLGGRSSEVGDEGAQSKPSQTQGGGGRPPSPPARPRGQLATNKIPFTSSF